MKNQNVMMRDPSSWLVCYKSLVLRGLMLTKSAVLVTASKTLLSAVVIVFAIQCMKQCVEATLGKYCVSLKQVLLIFQSLQVHCLCKQKDGFSRTSHFVPRCYVWKYTHLIQLTWKAITQKELLNY